MAWRDLVLGVGAIPALVMACESPILQGKFDASGEVCFELPTLGENYISATLKGVTDAQLLDGKNRRLRTLVDAGSMDGELTLLFALPVNQSSTLVLKGKRVFAGDFSGESVKLSL